MDPTNTEAPPSLEPPVEAVAESAPAPAEVAAPVEVSAPIAAPVPMSAPPVATAGPTYDPVVLARAMAEANAQYLGPVLRQIAPQQAPARPEWEADPLKWGTIPEGTPPDIAARINAERIAAVAKHYAAAERAAVRDELRQEMAQYLQGQQAYFERRYVPDQAITPVKAQFEKYERMGLSKDDALYLAQRDAGVHTRSAPPAPTSAPKPVPTPPRYATGPQARTVPPSTTKPGPREGQDSVSFMRDVIARQPWAQAAG